MQQVIVTMAGHNIKILNSDHSIAMMVIVVWDSTRDHSEHSIAMLE